MSDTDKNETPKPTAHDVTAPQARPMRPLVRKLNEVDFSLTESVQMFITVTPPVGTTREDMLTPSFWTHVARRMKPMSEVRAMPRDGNWYGVYLVIYADQSHARVKELSFHDLDSVADPSVEADQYFVKFISPPVRYGVIRKSDNHVMKDRFQTRESALDWKHQNLPG